MTASETKAGTTAIQKTNRKLSALSAINAIAFRAVGQKLGQALIGNRGRPVHAVGSLSIDRWQGEERMQFRLIDVASADPVDRLRG